MASPGEKPKQKATSKKRTIVHVVLPEDAVAKIDQIAEANHINRTAVVAIAIARFLENPNLAG